MGQWARMIITIDTSKDSKEDISKAIEFLKQFSEQSAEVKTYEPEPSASEAFGTMFSEKKVYSDSKKDPKGRVELY